jgi:hypothetical protein
LVSAVLPDTHEASIHTCKWKLEGLIYLWFRTRKGERNIGKGNDEIL